METQLIVTLVLLSLACGYLAWRGLQVWRGLKKGGCAGGCGCAKTATDSATQKTGVLPLQQLVLRQRTERSRD